MVYIPRGFVSLHDALAKLIEARTSTSDDPEGGPPGVRGSLRDLLTPEISTEFHQALAEGDLKSWLQSELNGGREEVQPQYWRSRDGRTTLVHGSITFLGDRYELTGQQNTYHAIVAKTDLDAWLAKDGAGPEKVAPELAPPTVAPSRTSTDAYKACVDCLRSMAMRSPERRVAVSAQESRCRNGLREIPWRDARKEAFADFPKWQETGRIPGQ